MTAFATLTVDFSAGKTVGVYFARYWLTAPNTETHQEIGDGADVRLPSVARPLNTEEAVAQYVGELSDSIFRNDSGSPALVKATTLASSVPNGLRIRISAGPTVPEVHDQHWELLADPHEDYRPLAWGQRTCLSRFMPSAAVRSPSRTPGVRLRAAALIASPSDLKGPAAVDINAEMAVVDESLSSARVRRLYGSRANLESLVEELQTGCDVLYLACHGKLKDGTPYFYFEDARRQTHLVEAARLASRIAEMKTPPPRLVVLASCESAGDSQAMSSNEGNFLSSAASHLVRAGVTAVVGMQGSIGQDDSRAFVTAFFKNLLARGQVESATAAARMDIPRRGQWWLPAVLVSVESGELWQGGPPRVFPNWDDLLTAFDRNEATPFLGSEVVEQLSKRNAAAHINAKLHHPQSTSRPLELQNVAQQLMIEQNKERLARALDLFYLAVERADGIDLPTSPVAESLSEWAKVALSAPAFDPYSEIASWPSSLFITANPDSLLEDALEAQKKAPQVIVCPWQDDTPLMRTDVPRQNLPLSPNAPVVYHLFGHLGRNGAKPNKNAPVITEDDFFDHLIWVSQHSTKYIPASIPQYLAMSSLVFLGFRLDDWEFRVVLRNIAKMQNVEYLAGNLHVAVQLDPTELTSEPADAVKALEDYFNKTEVKLSLYWGTVEDFLRELRRERQKRKRGISAGETGDTPGSSTAACSQAQPEPIDFSRP
jgi:hypothetical protein